MSKLPILSDSKIIKTFYKLGFRTAHKTKSGHIVLQNGERGCAVPLHKEVAIGTLSSILRQAGVSKEEFLNALYKKKR